MKRLTPILIILLLAVSLAWGWSYSYAADLHRVQLDGIVPFSIDTTFPQVLEKGNFKFRMFADGDFGALHFMVVSAKSIHDENYQILLLAVSTDGDKTIHIVGAMSGSMKGDEAKGLQAHRDESFFNGNGFSGVLTKCPDFPTPEDVERVAPKVKTGKLMI